ncbi:MAG: hypothetical protein AAFX87_25930 [Bacteroidota bacterium]
MSQTKSSYTLAIDKYYIAASGTPFTKEGLFSPLGSYGERPDISVVAHQDNSYSIAWLGRKSKKIKISMVSADHQLIKEIEPSYLPEKTFLLGFTALPNHSGFVIGYSRDNEHGNLNYEYWITHLDTAGTMVFNTRVFGDRPASEEKSKGEPAEAATARIIYHPNLKTIFFYLGHKMKWHDGVRHQGGYLGKMDLSGNFKGINTWLVSHNFDQRIIACEQDIAVAYHGDAYPRALGVRHFKQGDRAGPKGDFFNIEGEIGQNRTSTLLGGLVYLGRGRYGVSFATSQGKAKYEPAYRFLRPEGYKLAVHKTKWFGVATGSTAALPTLTMRDNGRLLVGFEELDEEIGKGIYTRFYTRKHQQRTVFQEIDHNGRVLTERMEFHDVQLPSTHEMVRLPNGNIIWAIASNSKDEGPEGSYHTKADQFTVFCIDRKNNNKRLYDSYDATYEKVMFDEGSGGFLIVNSTLKKNRKILIQITSGMAKEGDRIVLVPNTNKGTYKFTDALINDTPFKFLSLSKLSAKSTEKLKEAYGRGNKNLLITVPTNTSREQMITFLSPLAKRLKTHDELLVVSGDQTYSIHKADLL